MRIIVISDSFKGSLSSSEINRLFLENNIFNDEIKCFPIADGGEGTVEAISSFLKGNKITLTVKDPYLNDIEVNYFISNSNEAYIEVASSSGLPLVKNNPNPLLTHTIGVGEQILDAIKRKVKTIYLGLGGSATNDCGTGIAYALGYRFYDKDNNLIIPNGGNLDKITLIDTSNVNKELFNTKIIGLCDVKTTLLGINGCSYIYGPQKGANEKMIKQLDNNLEHINNLNNKLFLKDVSNIEGSGAAGGIGAAVLTYLNGKLQSGIEFFLNKINFNEECQKADLIITGEGAFDYQTNKGKVVKGIADITSKYKKDLIVICGINKTNKDSYLPQIKKIYSLVNDKVTIKMSMSNPKKYYIETLKKVLLENR